MEPIKMRVTPEQSEKVQKILFSKGIYWSYSRNNVTYLDSKFLYIRPSRNGGYSITRGILLNTFIEDAAKEVKADLFITTNGKTKFNLNNIDKD